ncbi:MAG: hypothetical protein RLZZ296_2003 [Pseudomonadota bacterium]|jgi:hypothetical protein
MNRRGTNGGISHKTSQLVIDVAEPLLRHHGFVVAAIDGPVHGARRAVFDVFANFPRSMPKQWLGMEFPWRQHIAFRSWPQIQTSRLPYLASEELAAWSANVWLSKQPTVTDRCFFSKKQTINSFHHKNSLNFLMPSRASTKRTLFIQACTLISKTSSGRTSKLFWCDTCATAEGALKRSSGFRQPLLSAGATTDVPDYCAFGRA